MAFRKEKMKYIFLFSYLILSLNILAQNSAFVLQHISNYKQGKKHLPENYEGDGSHEISIKYANYLVSQGLRAMAYYKIDSVQRIVMERNSDKNDSLYYYIKIVEKCKPWKNGEKSIYYDDEYCLVDVYLQKESIKKLEGINYTDSVYYYIEKESLK